MQKRRRLNVYTQTRQDQMIITCIEDRVQRITDRVKWNTNENPMTQGLILFGGGDPRCASNKSWYGRLLERLLVVVCS